MAELTKSCVPITRKHLRSLWKQRILDRERNQINENMVQFTYYLRDKIKEMYDGKI